MLTLSAMYMMTQPGALLQSWVASGQHLRRLLYLQVARLAVHEAQVERAATQVKRQHGLLFVGIAFDPGKVTCLSASVGQLQSGHAHVSN